MLLWFDGGRKVRVVMDKAKKIWHLYMNVITKPYKYLGEPDINKLDAFYWGMVYFFERSEGMLCYLTEDFREFLVSEKYHEAGGALGDSSIVLYYSKDPKEAFYRFYELLEEFIEIQGELYEPFRVRCMPNKNKDPFIDSSTEKVIWSLIYTKRTKIAVGAISLRLLEPFISGVLHSALTIKNKSYQLLPGFDEYLRERFSVEEKMNCYEIIQRNSMNDEEAFENYYEWVQDFLKEQTTDYEPVVEKDKL